MNKKAFSLIELSIVILIIGILVAGVTQGSRLISQFRLQNARSLTQSSPVASIKGLEIWYEASSEKSFSDANQEDGAFVDSWLDINPQSTDKADAAAALDDRPKYIASCINSIPCVRFDGVDDTLAFDGSFIANSNYSIFVVESRAEDVSNNMFIGGLPDASSLDLGYLSLDGEQYILHIHGVEWASGSGDYFYNVNMSALRGDSARSSVHSFFFEAGAGNDPRDTFYLFNGASTTKGLGIADVFLPISSWVGANIGHSGIGGGFYYGDISEIIMFSRKLKAKEASDVIKYLGKKYNINVAQN